VARLDQIPKSERLEPETLINKLKLSGKKAAYVLGAEAIVEHLKSRVEPGDVVCVLSNGSFDNIHDQLLEMLKA
jgi:UDP-N-acetylmuramate: L-alanyl-gamma-D-glutamyl-meso-diaminopimelate ligase